MIGDIIPTPPPKKQSILLDLLPDLLDHILTSQVRPYPSFLAFPAEPRAKCLRLSSRPHATGSRFMHEVILKSKTRVEDSFYLQSKDPAGILP